MKNEMSLMEDKKKIYHLAEVIALQQEALNLKEDKIREEIERYDKLRSGYIVDKEEVVNHVLKKVKDCVERFIDNIAQEEFITKDKVEMLKESLVHDFMYNLYESIRESNAQAKARAIREE